MDKTVLTLTEGRAGNAGFMVWSSDGRGLAIAVHDAGSAYEGMNAPSRPVSSAWRLFDLDTGEIRTLGTIAGAWLVPLSWDRQGGVATATETGRPPGERARFYSHSDAAQGIHELKIPADAIEPLSIKVDTTHTWALALEVAPCGSNTCRTLWTWPLRDPYAARSQTSSSGTFGDQAVFRPGTRDIFVSRLLDGPPVIQDIGPLGKGPPRTIPAKTDPLFFHFRQDGSALVIPNPDLNNTTGSLVRPDDPVTDMPMPLDSWVMDPIGGTPSVTDRIASFPSYWLLVGTADGRVYRSLSDGRPDGPSLKVCDAPVTGIITRQAGSFTALAICDAAGDGLEARGYLLDAYIFGFEQSRVVPLPGPMSRNAAFSTDARSLIYTTMGSCVSPAPICKTRVWMLDVGQGRIGTPREVMPEEYNLGEVRWTILGASMFKPQQSPNGIRPAEEAGTFVYDGSWRRYSEHRLIDAAAIGQHQAGRRTRAVLEVEKTDSTNAVVVSREMDIERVITPVGVLDERALVILDDGRVLAWRRGASDFSGELVTYVDGVARTDPGRFSAFGTFRAGVFGDAIVGLEYSGAPSLTLHSYAITDGTFASIPGGTATAIGALAITNRRR